MLRSLAKFAVCLAVLVGVERSASAGLITYTFSGVADGDLDGVSFTGASFLFTLTADTATVVDEGGGVLTNVVSSATFNIFGVGSGTLLDAYHVFSNQPINAVGFSHLPDGLDRVDVYDSALVLYSLATSIGPVSGDIEIFVDQFDDDPTTAGFLNLYNASSASFSAVTASAVPEPGTFTLLGLGAIGLCAGPIRRRHRR